MSKKSKLLQKARENPGGLRYDEAIKLAEENGFVKRGGKGSHETMKRPGYRRPLNFQDVKGMAKEYQVNQLLDALEELGLIDAE